MNVKQIALDGPHRLLALTNDGKLWLQFHNHPWEPIDGPEVSEQVRRACGDPRAARRVRSETARTGPYRRRRGDERQGGDEVKIIRRLIDARWFAKYWKVTRAYARTLARLRTP